MFFESSTGCWANTAAAVLPKQARGTLRKHFTTPFSQPDDPDCTLNLILYRHRLTSIDLSLDTREGESLLVCTKIPVISEINCTKV